MGFCPESKSHRVSLFVSRASDEFHHVNKQYVPKATAALTPYFHDAAVNTLGAVWVALASLSLSLPLYRCNMSVQIG